MAKFLIPKTITAGLTFSAAVNLFEHRAPGWAVSLHLRGPQSIDLAGAGDGARHEFTASAAATAEWNAGEYWYSLRATDGDNVVELATGSVRVVPDLVSAPAGFDGRSQAQIALDAIEAVLANRATIDQERYRINNRELYRTPIAELLKLRSFYVVQVRRENGQGRGRWGRPVAVRFTQ